VDKETLDEIRKIDGVLKVSLLNFYDVDKETLDEIRKIDGVLKVSLLKF
jgi:nitrate reductase NapAB chaperone NapD